ncbi:MAG: M48 family metallopeptidase [Pseudomonadota bacterium]
MRGSTILLLAALALGGCATALPVPPAVPSDPSQRNAAEQAALNFVTVVDRVEPVAERECRERTDGVDCDFQIFVDDRPGVPPNAFQTVDRRGRPAIIFTLALIADARNQDELAFILGHEAGHHIAGHIPKSEVSAQIGAVVFGSLAEAAGQSRREINEAAQLGAEVGARRFAKEFELEADRLGTIIAARAGYDPVRGAGFFARVPDPGDQFLGTHPPNAERQEVVRRTAASLR